MGKPHLGISSHVHKTKMDGKLQACDLRDAHLELALLNLDDDQH